MRCNHHEKLGWDDEDCQTCKSVTKHEEIYKGLNKEERWKLVHYIRAKFMETGPAMDSTAVMPVENVEEVTAEVVEAVEVVEENEH